MISRLPARRCRGQRAAAVCEVLVVVGTCRLLINIPEKNKQKWAARPCTATARPPLSHRHGDVICKGASMAVCVILVTKSLGSPVFDPISYARYLCFYYFAIQNSFSTEIQNSFSTEVPDLESTTPHQMLKSFSHFQSLDDFSTCSPRNIHAAVRTRWLYRSVIQNMTFNIGKVSQWHREWQNHYSSNRVWRNQYSSDVLVLGGPTSM